MSSNVIHRFDYDRTARRLDVQFVSGNRYSFFDVPERIVENMRKTMSRCTFFNHRVRNRFRSARMH
ncbi:MAG: KTSC domain-containing protein [Sphingobium sp.]